jgi:hypothetical protein
MSTHPQSPFRHAICAACWDAQNPGRVPFRLNEPELEQCCFCGAPTSAGIYTRGPRQPYCDLEVK